MTGGQNVYWPRPAAKSNSLRGQRGTKVRKGKVQIKYIKDKVCEAKRDPGRCRSISPWDGDQDLTVWKYRATCLMVLYMHRHKHAAYTAQCIRCHLPPNTYKHTQTHTLWPPGLCALCSTVCSAKSHSLSSREVQKSRGRWYVTESRLRMNVCVFLCVCQVGHVKVSHLVSAHKKKGCARV